jgi:hypothetical protein
MSLLLGALTGSSALHGLLALSSPRRALPEPRSNALPTPHPAGIEAPPEHHRGRGRGTAETPASTVGAPRELPVGSILAAVRWPVAWPSSRGAETALWTSRFANVWLSAGWLWGMLRGVTEWRREG